MSPTCHIRGPFATVSMHDPDTESTKSAYMLAGLYEPQEIRPIQNGRSAPLDDLFVGNRGHIEISSKTREVLGRRNGALRGSRSNSSLGPDSEPRTFQERALSTPPRAKESARKPRSKRSALQRHCDFWDADHDGLIYPWDIYIGFRKLGFNIALCLWAAVSMAICSSYATQPGWRPHPLFAINVDNIHRSRHGSTTATYDMDAEIDMRRFEAIFDKYGEGRDYLTLKTLYSVWAGQCCAYDWFGWFAGGLECKLRLAGSRQKADHCRDRTVHSAVA